MNPKHRSFVRWALGALAVGASVSLAAANSVSGTAAAVPAAALLAALRGPVPPAPQGANGVKSIAPATATFVEVHEPSATLRLWLDPELIAEFEPSAAGSVALLAESPGAVQAFAPSDRLRVWRCGRGEAAATVLRRMRQRDPGCRFAESLHLGGGPDAPRVLFPGGVVVFVDATLDPTTARDFLLTEGLVVRRELVAGRNVFEVESRAGLDALELAERLRQRSAIVAAMPVRWTAIAAF